MKRILTSLLILAMVLPMFGQKVNSRGEKMVSSIYMYDGNGNDKKFYEFEYNKDGSLAVIKTDRATYQKSGDKISLLNSDGQIDVTAFFELNSDGLITVYKKLNEPQRWNWFQLREYTYEYNDLLRKYSVVEKKSSDWTGERMRKPRLSGGNVSHTAYEYENGNPHQNMFSSDARGERGTSNYSINEEFNDKVDDTNISIYQLLLSGNEYEITEWCPSYSKNLPEGIMGVNGYLSPIYEYNYADGNIVAIDVYTVWKQEKKLKNTYKINYIKKK